MTHLQLSPIAQSAHAAASTRESRRAQEVNVVLNQLDERWRAIRKGYVRHLVDGEPGGHSATVATYMFSAQLDIAVDRLRAAGAW
jgi:hypothetical protein